MIHASPPKTPSVLVALVVLFFRAAGVAVLVDVQNTLVNTAILKFGSDAVREKYLPKLATGACTHPMCVGTH